MFTGLVEEVGTIATIKADGAAVQISIAAKLILSDVQLGASIAVNGCCLTVVNIAGTQLTFDAGEETLRRTNLGQRKPGDQINLERALQAGNRLGGHYVTGHIDGLGTVRSRTDEGEWSTIWIIAPPELTRQMASKGSIAVDGVSLTLVEVVDDAFSVMLVPHTLKNSTLGRLGVRDSVNLETDLLAKYVQRQCETAGWLSRTSSELSSENS